MFAGPNGSGKSTIFNDIKSQLKIDFGVYINADEIENQIKEKRHICLNDFNIDHKADVNYFNYFIQNHTLYDKAQKNGFPIDIKLKNNKILNPNHITHSYEAAIIADFIRYSLINHSKKLTFETVMSHYSKIETLKYAKEKGYKNYLYFISTESEKINVNRVKARISKGGHPVPENKIISRYFNSLDYLLDAIKHTHTEHTYLTIVKVNRKEY